MAKTARVELKLEPDMKAAVQKKAQDEKRSVNQVIELAIEYYLKGGKK